MAGAGVLVRVPALLKLDSSLLGASGLSAEPRVLLAAEVRDHALDKR